MVLPFDVCLCTLLFYLLHNKIMAAKDCSGCGSIHEPPLHRRCPLRPGNSEDQEDPQSGDSQASFMNSTDTRAIEQQGMDTPKQVSGSGLIDNSSSDTSAKTTSTDILLLRELKSISKRFHTLEEQAAKDRLVIASMASKIQAQESRNQSERVNLIMSPRKEQVRQSTLTSQMNSVTSLHNVNQTLTRQKFLYTKTKRPYSF